MAINKPKIHASNLYCFDAVRKLGSIREAAKSLHIASSAISRQIQKLEENLDVQLFERSAQGLTLTAAGESFARHCQLVLQDTDRLFSDLDAIKGIQKGHIEIATVEGPSVELIPHVIRLFRDQFPKISIGIKVTGSTEVAELILNGHVDIGLAFDLDHVKGLHQLWVSKYPIGAVVPTDHPFADKTQLTFAECSNFPVIVSQRNLSIFKHLARLMPLLDPNHDIIQTNSVALARQLVLEGQGIAFQTQIGIEQDISAGLLRHIPIQEAHLNDSELGIYVRSNRILPQATEQFIKILTGALKA